MWRLYAILCLYPGNMQCAPPGRTCSDNSTCYLPHDRNNNNNSNNDNNNNNNNSNRTERRNSRFFTISSLRRKLSTARTFKWAGRNRMQITCTTFSAYHAQHALCHLVRRDSSATKCDSLNRIYFKLYFLGAEPLTDEEYQESTNV